MENSKGRQTHILAYIYTNMSAPLWWMLFYLHEIENKQRIESMKYTDFIYALYNIK